MIYAPWSTSIAFSRTELVLIESEESQTCKPNLQILSLDPLQIPINMNYEVSDINRADILEKLLF